MALVGINSVNRGERRTGIEKILDSALKVAQLTNFGVDIVTGLKDRKLNREAKQSEMDMATSKEAREIAGDLYTRNYQDEMLKLSKEKEDNEKSYKDKYLKVLEKNAETKASQPEKATLLPEDRPFINTLATQNAKKIAISNQIDGYMAEWDKASDDKAKLDIGRKLLKILNSTEGADAIGVEESSRLGSKLEFATGNLFNNNPVQFGRDLKGFREDAVRTSQAIKGAVKANQGMMDKVLSKYKGRQIVDSMPENESIDIGGVEFNP